MRAAIIGAGAFGSALAKMLADRGHEVVLWCWKAEDAEQIRAARESVHLPGVKLPESIAVVSDLAQALAGREVVLGVTPSHGVRKVIGEAARWLEPGVILVNASKGIEEGTLATIDQIYREVLPEEISRRAVFLSGPTFAKELARGLPAAIVAASGDPASARRVQDELFSERLRVYTTDDVVGVELAGALKNVVAIGAGAADGLGFGHNTRAMLITRGLAEMSRLGVRLGAHPLTFAGLAGMGDLVLTCTGDLSRNRTVGLELGRGRKLAEILAGMNAVAEGVKTTAAAHQLAQRLGVEAPITAAVHSVLYEDKPVREAVAELMRREAKPERG